MARTKGSYSLSANIEVSAGAPLDARDRVSSMADLTASGTFPYHYVGMETYVVSANKKYRLIGNDPTVLANWEEVGSGGHTIEDSTGTDMTARSNLQFTGGSVSVSDDETNDRTVVEMPDLMPASDMEDIVYPLPDPHSAPKLDELSNVTISNVTNGQIIKYNSSSRKWVNANDEGGTEVIANPTGTATDDLEKIQIGAGIYAIPEGTSVEANPTGTATDDLTKIEIDGTIYGIPDTDTNELADMQDVNLSSVTNGQVLKYNSTTSKWENANESGGGGGGGGHTIEDPTGTSMAARSNLQFTGDVVSVTDDITNDRTVVELPDLMPAADMIDIVYPLPDPNPAQELDDLTNVTINNVTNGQVLKYDSSSSKWVNDDESGGGGDLTIDDLTNVTINNATTGQVLKYNATNEEWVNANESGGSSGSLVQCYIVGSTPYATDWLSIEPGGSPLIPNSSSLYLILDTIHVLSSYSENILRFDTISNTYKSIMGVGLKTLLTQTNTFSTVNSIYTDYVLSSVSSISGYEGTTFKINFDGLTVGNQYIFNADFQLLDTPNISTSYSWSFGIESSNITSYSSLPSTAKTNLPRTTDKTNLSLTFTANNENYLVYYLSAINRANLPIKMSNMTISEVS